MFKMRSRFCMDSRTRSSALFLRRKVDSIFDRNTRQSTCSCVQILDVPHSSKPTNPLKTPSAVIEHWSMEAIP